MALLDVQSLTKHYRHFEAVHDLSFSIDDGSCVSLLGPNGAGKTTTLKMLAGLIPPTSGKILIDGATPRDIRRYIGYLPQQPSFHEWMTGVQFLEYVAKLVGIHRAEARKRSLEMLEMVGLKEAGNRTIGGYSGGMRQRLGIAQALIHRPRLVIMDEPVSALDPVGRHEVLQLIGQIRSDTTVLFSTHVLHDAEEVSDAILILVQGKIVLAGDFDSIRKEHQQPVIRLQSETSLTPYIDAFKQVPSVLQVEGSGRMLSLFTEDIPETRRAVLELALNVGLPIERLEVGQTSLEDLFLKVVAG